MNTATMTSESVGMNWPAVGVHVDHMRGGLCGRVVGRTNDQAWILLDETADVVLMDAAVLAPAFDDGEYE